MTFGEKLRESRKTSNLTQKQLADKIGAKHNSVSDWENDKNKPDPDTIELLCGVLGISPNYLLNSNSDDFSAFEKELIKKYRDLDDEGRETVTLTIERETKRSKQIKEARERMLAYQKRLANLNIVAHPNIAEFSPLEANAAHDRTDIEVTDEMKEHDDKFFNED